MRRVLELRAALRLTALLALAGCAQLGPSAPDPQTSLRPVAPAAPRARPAPSERSLRLAAYYRRLQADDLAHGLLRKDGGGPDTPFDATDLARNFERIAFFGEYPRGAALSSGGDHPDVLRRWQGPVRLGLIFGDSVDEAVRRQDRTDLGRYAARLARVTGHPISHVSQGANFHVLVMGEDDRAQALAQIRALVPAISYDTMAVLGRLPRDVHCLVLGFGAPETDRAATADGNPAIGDPTLGDGPVYRSAIALIRAEHPDLTRRACLHEEIAQGLGLRNDYDKARPSIFNDDSEFALLTTQDEMMLKMLYDPRLKPGMTADEARPTVQALARELTGDI
ncbi:DUF2927 domain-containing protein [Pseudooceanicola sediminis]|uniref:DUF2927 domain-containing protein n=1 Tax=Pseudooceanicola sediminis TaxID=2211117 RepID=UPI001F2A1EDC